MGSAVYNETTVDFIAVEVAGFTFVNSFYSVGIAVCIQSVCILIRYIK